MKATAVKYGSGFGAPCRPNDPCAGAAIEEPDEAARRIDALKAEIALADSF